MREFDAIEAIGRMLGDPPRRVRTGLGDDAAVTKAGAFAVSSVDSVVDSVHFERSKWNGESIGWKAVASAASDLAAMAADPADLLIAAGLPDDLTEHELTNLFTGITAAARSCGMTVIGGDTVGSPVLWLSVTVTGYVDSPDQVVTRSGGHAGDVLAVTGSLGASRAGLALIQDSRLQAEAGLSPGHAAALIACQQRPVPRLLEAVALRDNGVTAMIDISDGLAGDLAHLSRASGCGAEIDLAALPVSDCTAAVAAAVGQDPTEFAAGGGEDYELLVALAPESAEAARAAVVATGTALTPIGKLVPSGPVRLTRPDGTDAQLKSFEHLS